MIDGRYTDGEWQAIASILRKDHPQLPHDVDRVIRQRLEHAAARYTDKKLFADQMRGSAEKRKQWESIYADAVALLHSVSAVERWHAPLWPHDDPERKAQTVELLRDLADHAQFTAGDYRNDDQCLGPREWLNIDVLGVWTDLLQQDFGWSDNGPAVRFLQAVLRPIVEAPPANTTVRGILKREEARRTGRNSGKSQSTERTVVEASTA